jgi:glycosyltransferase involved in cell wall biosynthesis
MEKQKVSVILPFRNEILTLEECLLSFINQTYKNKEIILVDSDSTDGSSELAKKFSKKYKYIKYYNSPYVPGRWATSFYITAMQYATGDIIYMADGNVRVAKDYFKRNVEILQDPKVAGVIGKVRMWDTSSAISKYRSIIWELRYGDSKIINKEINKGMILPRMFSKKAFDAVGGFNPKAGWAIDIFLAKSFLKNGYKLVYDSKSIWWHKWRDQPKQLLKYNLKFGKLNFDIDKNRPKQWLKSIYFLLPIPIIIISLFNYKFLLLLILHPVPLLLNAIRIYLISNNSKLRNYSFVGLYLAYLQNVPYAIGFFKGLFKI